MRYSIPITLVMSLAGFSCSGPAPSVPEIQPNTGECMTKDAAQTTERTTAALPAPQKKKPGLAVLKPGVRKGPLKLGQMLSMHHPPSDVQWRALPPTADAELITIIGDSQTETTTRARAMSGLAVRKTEGARDPLIALLAKDTDETIRRSAVRSLVVGYLEVDGGPVTTALGAGLADPSSRLRETIVKALTPFVSRPTIRTMLDARAKTEADPLVKEALATALSH